MSAANPADERSESGGGAGTTLKKTIKTREDPDPPPNSSYFRHENVIAAIYVRHASVTPPSRQFRESKIGFGQGSGHHGYAQVRPRLQPTRANE